MYVDIHAHVCSPVCAYANVHFDVQSNLDISATFLQGNIALIANCAYIGGDLPV